MSNKFAGGFCIGLALLNVVFGIFNIAAGTSPLIQMGAAIVCGSLGIFIIKQGE